MTHIEEIYKYISKYELKTPSNTISFVIYMLKLYITTAVKFENIYHDIKCNNELILTFNIGAIHIRDYKYKKEILYKINKCILSALKFENIPTECLITKALCILDSYGIEYIKTNNKYSIVNKPKNIDSFNLLTCGLDSKFIIEYHDYVINLNNKTISTKSYDSKSDSGKSDDNKSVTSIDENKSDNKKIIIVESPYSNIRNIIKIKTIDSITDYFDNLLYSPDVIKEFHKNINKLKEYYYMYGKLDKPENKKYMISNTHKQTLNDYIKNIRYNSIKMIPRIGNFNDNKLLKKIGISTDEFNIYFKRDYHQTDEYKEGLSS